MKNILQKALRRMRRRGLTQLDVAAASGLSPSTVSRLVNGKRVNAPLDSVVRFLSGVYGERFRLNVVCDEGEVHVDVEGLS